MTFYKYAADRSILYVTPNGTGYIIGVYTEEYPDGRSERVTGTADEISDSKKDRYIDKAEDSDLPSSGEIDRNDVPWSAIETLQRKLSEDMAP